METRQPQSTSYSTPSPSSLPWRPRIRFGRARPQPGLPAILEACQESRHEALTFYTPCKETSIGNTRGETTSSGTIYINFDIDQFDHILHEVSDSFSAVPSYHHNFNTETMRSIKFLIFALGQNWPRGSLSDVEFVEWGSLPQLQEFHMLAEAPCHYPVRDKSLDEPLANGVADALGEELLRKEGECQYLRYLELDKEFEMGIIFFTAISFNERTCPQVKSRYFG
ncbi:uncharacterized protein PAC_13484 [Phialocephala subalpina]|uniref:2EXR domain-containing protein n=1 Tax=Phialocephala subalpina TaxID=576137 RepID=A0A1L7XF57_9HELO|nr:uncharacterized protein PAC_13484 [Phialocephala subalpina]